MQTRRWTFPARKAALAVAALVLATALAAAPAPADGAKGPTRKEVADELRRAVTFFRQEVATRGAYVYRYSADLEKREGEGKVGATTGWVQPPGTPTVGEALVEVYELTGEAYAMEAAREAAGALISTQLHSGGWDARIEMAGEARQRFAYRADGRPGKRARNNTSLDDDKTQSCIRFLLRLDRATGFSDEAVHRVAVSALESLLAAQFPNGAWPHVYTKPAEPRPVVRASYADDGGYQRVKNYWDFYTLNDRLVSDVVDALFLAEEIYGGAGAGEELRGLARRSREAAERAGDFLILAQMPEPQPGWAQQYDFEMRPVWARKFEPPAITGGEAQSVMMTLLDIYERTGERKYLGPLPAALKYYRASLLPDGRLARFYELKTNRPLYFNRRYELTYDDTDMPTHYGFKVGSKLDAIERRYRDLASKPWRAPDRTAPARPSAAEARRLVRALDGRGAWVEDGRLRYWGKGDPTRRVIESRTFARNVITLARFVGVPRESAR